MDGTLGSIMKKERVIDNIYLDLKMIFSAFMIGISFKERNEIKFGLT